MNTYIVTTTGAAANVYLKDIGLVNPIVHPATVDLIALGVTLSEIQDSSDLYDALNLNYLTATFNGVSIVAGQDTKQDRLVSGTNIKTINGTSVLGSGDITITDTGIQDPGANGIVVRTALNTATARSIAVTSGHLSVTNGDGVSGNPTLGLPAVGISGTYVSVTTDAQGRVSSGSTTQAWSTITSTPTTLSGYGITDATPSSHIGSGGSAHADATISASGFMSATDKSKLDGIAAGAQPGTVTTVSVSNVNGFSGAVTNATTTPAIAIQTTVTGVLVGNGTGVAAAVSGTDFKTINSTSILGSGNIVSGDVTGPASSTDNAIARFDLATGKVIQNSAVGIDDSGNLTTVNSIQNTALTTPPTSPVHGQTYFDDDYDTMMYYDSVRAKWLSVESYIFTVARDGNLAAGVSLQSAGSLATSTTPIPVGDHNVCLVGVRTSTSGAENFTLGIRDIASGGSATSYTLAVPSGTVYSNSAVNQNFTAGDALDTYINALGGSGSVNRPSVTYILKKRK